MLKAMPLQILLLTLSAASLVAVEVSGRVVDESGFALPGASVLITNAPNGTETFQATTKEDGSYSVANVPFGTYSMQASVPGFVSVRYEPLEIRYLTFRFDFHLPLGPGNEGGVSTAAMLIGTLRSGSRRLGAATLCLNGDGIKRCTTANQIGEYQVSIAPGRYSAVVKQGDEVLWHQEIELPRPAEYRDIIRKP